MAGAEEPQECQDQPLPVPDPPQGHQRATLQGSQLPSPRKWTLQNRQVAKATSSTKMTLVIVMNPMDGTTLPCLLHQASNLPPPSPWQCPACRQMWDP